MTVWEQALEIKGIERPLRRVLRLTERTIEAKGQILIEPRLTLEGWSTSLLAQAFDAQAIIALYADHGTHEQFHSEFKTDLDLERLPSGKFDTNYLVCELAALAMNILRLDGPGRPARPGCSGATPGQAQTHQASAFERLYGQLARASG